MENQVKKYFNVLRQNEDLSYGGFRTLKLIEDEFDRLCALEKQSEQQSNCNLPHVSKNEVAGCDHCRDEQGFTIGNMYVCDKCGRQVP